MSVNEISKDVLSRFYYDPTSESGLRWAVRRGTRCSIGDVAGYVNSGSGYYMVETGSRCYFVSRIIYLLVRGDIPEGFVVDHVDGDKANNHISNLNCILHQHNTHNCKIRSDNKSGFKGVHYKEVLSTAGNKLRYWVVTWMENSKVKEKLFSLQKHGDNAKSLAIEYRLDIISKLNNSGANYTERHIGITNEPLHQYRTQSAKQAFQACLRDSQRGSI